MFIFETDLQLFLQDLHDNILIHISYNNLQSLKLHNNKLLKRYICLNMPFYFDRKYNVCNSISRKIKD